MNKPKVPEIPTRRVGSANPSWLEGQERLRPPTPLPSSKPPRWQKAHENTKRFFFLQAYTLIRAYVFPRFDLYTIPDELGKNMVKVSHLEYRVVTYLESLYPGEVESSFNSVNRRRYAGSLPDAVIKRLKKLFYVNGCRFHPHWVNKTKD